MASSERRYSVDITSSLERYLRDQANPDARYTSFDYCFNYFQSHAEQNHVENLASPGQLQMSCLQLGFYLASWGMFRGSAELLSKSVHAFVPVINTIVAAPPAIWKLDVDGYDEEGIQLLLDVSASLRRVLPGGHSDTLVTKTMLGVFGCVPAFDSYFKQGFVTSGFGRKSLAEIRAYYERNADAIDRHRVRTWGFADSCRTERKYTRAKVIDMIFFIAGGPG